MSNDKLDQALELASNRVERERKLCEDFVPKFIEVIGLYLREWGEQLMDRTIEGNLDHTKQLESDKLGEMKQEVTDLFDKYPKLAEETMGNIVDWVHRSENLEISTDIQSQYDLRDKCIKSMDEVVRLLIGRIGAIIVKYGFNESGTTSNWAAVGEGEYRYSYGLSDYGLSYGEQYRQYKEEYRLAINEYLQAVAELQRATKAKDAAEAKNLWDNA